MWGPIREETFSWFHRLLTGANTPHTTAKEGHENLAICMAIDCAAKTGSGDQGKRAKLCIPSVSGAWHRAVCHKSCWRLGGTSIACASSH